MQFFIQSCLISKWAKENVFYYCYYSIYINFHHLSITMKLIQLQSFYFNILKSGYRDKNLRLACIQPLVTIQQHADANTASNHLGQ